MRIVVSVGIGLSLLIGLTAGLRAEDEDTEREIQERCRLMNETVGIQLLEHRVRSLERWNQAYVELTESYAKTLKVGRHLADGSARILRQRITQLEEALETERKREGINESELLQQLAAEQIRHTQDVVMLQTELMNANEIAEANRLEAIQKFKCASLHEETAQQLRKQLVQSLWFLGVVGPHAKAALPWLRQLDELEDEVLTEAAKGAIQKIERDGE